MRYFSVAWVVLVMEVDVDNTYCGSCRTTELYISSESGIHVFFNCVCVCVL